MIYFAQAPDGGPIKIGLSIDPVWRLGKIRKDHGLELNLLATIDGGRGKELDLHDRFASSRCQGCCPGVRGIEWFHPTASLADCIRSLGGSVAGEIAPDPMQEHGIANERDGAALLRRFLRNKNLSNERVARRLGYSAMTVGQWVRGKRVPCDMAAETIEIWTEGEVPKVSWMCTDGHRIVPCLGHARGCKPASAHREILETTRTIYYGGRH